MKSSIPLYRLCLGAFIATALVPLVIYFPNSFISSFIGKGFYAVLIIVSTFGFRNVYQVMSIVFVFYFISFAVGGGLFGLHYLMQQSSDSIIHNFLFYVNN